MEYIKTSLYVSYAKIILNNIKDLNEDEVYHYIELMETNGFIPNPMNDTFINLESSTIIKAKYFNDDSKINNYIKLRYRRNEDILIDKIAKSYSNNFTLWEKFNEIITILLLIVTIILFFTSSLDIFFMSTFFLTIKSWETFALKFWQEFCENNSFNINQKLQFRINYPNFYLYLGLLASILALVMLIKFKVGFTFEIVKNEYMGAVIYILFIVYFIFFKINPTVTKRYSDLFMSNYLNKYLI